MNAPTPFAKAALAPNAGPVQRKGLGKAVARALLVLAFAGTCFHGSEASAGWRPSRRAVCTAAVVGAAVGVGALFHRELDALWLGIPRQPVEAQQLEFNGISADPLVNLRQKVFHLHGVRVDAVVEGPEAVTQDELGRFLTNVLKEAGSFGEKPALWALLPPRTVRVRGGAVTETQYEDDLVLVHWSRGTDIVREQFALIDEAERWSDAIEKNTGVLLVPSRDGIAFEKYVEFLRAFHRRAGAIPKEAFARANFVGAPVAVVDEARANRWGVALPARSVSLGTLDAVLDGVRRGEHFLPNAVAPAVQDPQL